MSTQTGALVSLLVLTAASMAQAQDSGFSNDYFPLEKTEYYYNWIEGAQPLQGMRWIAPEGTPPVSKPSGWGDLYTFGDNIIGWWPGDAYLRDDLDHLTVVCLDETAATWRETGFRIPATLEAGLTWTEGAVSASVEQAGRQSVFHGTFSNCLSLTFTTGTGYWELVLAPGVGIIREKGSGMCPEGSANPCEPYEIELADTYREE